MERACAWQLNSLRKSWQSDDLTSPVRLVYLSSIYFILVVGTFHPILEKYDCNRLVSHLGPPVSGSGLCAYQSRRNDRNFKGELGPVFDIPPCTIELDFFFALSPPGPATVRLGYQIWDFFLCSFVYIDFFFLKVECFFPQNRPHPKYGRWSRL